MTETLTKLKPATFRYLESEVYAYPEMKKEIARLREEILHGYSNTDENTGGGRSSEPGRPTERIATRLMSDKRLRNLEEMVEAIETAFFQVSGDHQKVINLKYWSGKNLNMESLADACFMHRNTASKYRREFISLLSEKLGLK